MSRRTGKVAPVNTLTSTALGAAMVITSVVQPDQGANIWSGTAKIGNRNLEWFYRSCGWLHVREQEPGIPRCWMNIETPAGAQKAVQRAIDQFSA